MLTRPQKDEYGGHFSHYVELVPEGDLLTLLEEQNREAAQLFSTFAEEQANDSYAPGKWTLKELLSHAIDTERIMTARLHRIARGDEAEQPGFNQDIYTAHAHANRLSLSFLIDELAAVRSSTLFLLRGIPEEEWKRTAQVSGYRISARALAYVVQGHLLHHLNVVRDRYRL
ncbi:DinB family protein [Gorillibacterium sp. CAU 1737]|uniref:DinB family protein n=1 Tax=Gorillibacterium sp. CAU 1737 TaxID=3140362 RepID=UPI003260B118